MPPLPNPYVGPRPFGPDEQHLFFGRSSETEILTSMVVARRASLLFAPSGAGKSSLLMAGLRPSLLEHRRVVRGRERIEPLAAGFVVARVGRGRPELQPRNVFVQSALLSIAGEAEPPESSDVALSDGLRRRLAPRADAPERGDTSALPFVLVFDQFEELFTKHLEHRSEREHLFLQVRDALAAEDRLRVLFSIREDFLGELEPYAHLLPDDLRHRLRLERLGEAAALEAVRRPPEQAPVPRPYAEGVAEKVVRNLRAGTSDEIEPILLQVVCNRIWRDLPPGTGEIRLDDIAKLSTIDRALMDYYDCAVASALVAAEPVVGPVSERLVRRFLAEAFVTSSGTRAPVHRDDQTGLTGAGVLGGVPNVVVDALAASEVNLLRAEQRAGSRWYELAHDRLIKPLRAANEAWEQQHQTALHRRALRWRTAGELEGDLADATDLAELRRALESAPDEPLDDVDEEFLDRSEKRLLSLRVSQRANVEELGWGVVFAADDPLKEEIRGALAELLEHRARQRSARFERQEFEYRPGETAQSFLARHGGAAAASSAALGEMPYYLLIVAHPERIPFEVQYGLAMRHAVGRLHFEADTWDETLSMYASYARSVVVAENGEWALPRRALVLVPGTPDDMVIECTQRYLVRPLLQDLQAADLLQADWEVEEEKGGTDTRAAVLEVLGGARTPAVAFVAGHGAEFPAGDFRQPGSQGALIWRDSAGDSASTALVTARDIGDDARLLGLIAFLFVPFSAGTPRFANVDRRELAPSAFVSRLAQRLLGHPRGGALAVIGHVDVSWVTSFYGRGTTPDDRTFEGPRTFAQAVSRIMRGHTVGSAMEPLAARYRLVASELVDAVLAGATPEELQALKIGASDLRSYVLLGDPAVRLPLEGPISEERPTIAPTQLAELPARKTASAPGPSGVLGAAPRATVDGSEGEGVVVFNGVNPMTGYYFQAPASFANLAARARDAGRSSP